MQATPEKLQSSEASKHAFPLGPVRPPGRARAVDRLEVFLEQQMDQFTLSGPRFAQTYRLSTEQMKEEPLGKLYLRADTYDSAVACIFFLQRGRVDRARDLGDALVAAVDHDELGGGRIVAASRANELLDRGNGNTTSIFAGEAKRDVGNMSWAGMALTRLYHRTRVYRYLHTAETIGQWILANCTRNDDWGGFTGGEEYDAEHKWVKRTWRSVEHNVDAFSLFANLHYLTGEARWEEASRSAARLVRACRVTVPRNPPDSRERPTIYYCAGTKVLPNGEHVLNTEVVPTDAQSWTALSRIDPECEEDSLKYMFEKLGTTTEITRTIAPATTIAVPFRGTRFAQHGTEVQNEATAGAAMALWLSRAPLKQNAEEFYASLLNQLDDAPNANHYGIVATPAAQADTGMGWKYFNLLHVASTAWTGLALLARDDATANPYAPLSNLPA